MPVLEGRCLVWLIRRGLLFYYIVQLCYKLTMKVALVHDWLNTLGGAERVLIELHKIFPEAPVYTLFANQKFTNEFLPSADVRPSFLNSIPLITKIHKYFFFLMPIAAESFNLSDYDMVISSSVNFSKGLVLKPKTKHICYCYSPARFLWDRHTVYNGQNNFGFKDWVLRLFQHILRIWDRQTADRVDQFVAISEHVRGRIQKYYRKDAEVIYPPLIPNFQFPISNKFPISQFQNYYLIVSRLYPHKNIDVAIDAFNKLGLPLVIIGDGPEYGKLKSQSAKCKNIKLLLFVSDKKLSYYYQNCRAFIMPQEEDFGLTPIEAMSFGKPVLALGKGGALETVVEGMTGEFFDDPIPEALADGVRRLNENYKNYNADVIKAHVRKFSREEFRNKILSLAQ